MINLIKTRRSCDDKQILVFLSLKIHTKLYNKMYKNLTLQIDAPTYKQSVIDK